MLSVVIQLDELLYDRSMNVGEPIISALELIGQSFVIDPHLMQEGCVQVVNADRVFDDIVAIVVSRAIG